MTAFGLERRERIGWMAPIFIQGAGVRKRFAVKVSCLLVWKIHSTENMGSNYKVENNVRCAMGMSMCPSRHYFLLRIFRKGGGGKLAGLEV